MKRLVCPSVGVVEKLIGDRKAGKKLKQIASELGIALPEQPDEQARILRGALAQLSGDLLAKEYA